MGVSHNEFTSNTKQAQQSSKWLRCNHNRIFTYNHLGNNTGRGADSGASLAFDECTNRNLEYIITNNNFVNNDFDYVVISPRVPFQESTTPLNFTNNYWGTTTQEGVEAMIKSFEDPFLYREIAYQPFQTSPIPEAGVE